MTAEEAFFQMIDGFLKKIPVSVSIGTVEDIDSVKRTCSVAREDRPTLHNVRLNSVIGNHADHFTVFPRIGSYVLCLMIDEPTNCMVIATSEVDEISAKVENTEMLINKSGIKFNGGNLGGMIKISELTDKINGLVEKFNSHTHTVNTTGTAAAQTGTAAATTSQAATLSKSDYENERVKQ